MDSQRVFAHSPDAKHPTVSLAASHRSPHLIGKRLERDLVIGLCQSATDGTVGSLLVLHATKGRDRLFVAPLHQVHESVEGDQPGPADRGILLDLVSVQGLEEEGGPHTLIKVAGALPELLQLFTGLEFLRYASSLG